MLFSLLLHHPPEFLLNISLFQTHFTPTCFFTLFRMLPDTWQTPNNCKKNNLVFYLWFIFLMLKRRFQFTTSFFKKLHCNYDKREDLCFLPFSFHFLIGDLGYFSKKELQSWGLWGTWCSQNTNSSSNSVLGQTTVFIMVMITKCSSDLFLLSTGKKLSR